MISEEEYMKFLNAIISCINHGDYYSIKELSKLEIEKIKKKGKKENREVKILKMLNENM